MVKTVFYNSLLVFSSKPEKINYFCNFQNLLKDFGVKWLSKLYIWNGKTVKRSLFKLGALWVAIGVSTAQWRKYTHF